MKNPDFNSKNPKISTSRRLRNGSQNLSHGLPSASNAQNEIDLFQKPEVTKHLLEQALKSKSLAKYGDISVKSPEFKKERNSIVQEFKQKVSFVAGSFPMVRILKDINIATAQNPPARIPIHFFT
jgi:hypothetical protein